MFFKIKRKSPLKKLMDVYAQRQGGTPSAYRFIFDGNRIVETQTPDDVRARPARAPRAAAAAVLLPVHRSGPSQRPRSPDARAWLQLEMENDDVIDAMLEQVGGC